MTETTFASPRLERPAEAPLGGVCLALARTTGTDPVLWRVLFVVTSFFGGIGAIVYVIAYFAIPREGEQHAVGERLLRGPDRRVSALQILLLALVVVATVLALNDNAGVVLVTLVGALGFVWWRRRHLGDPAAPLRYAGSAPASTPPAPAAGPSGAPAEASAEAPAQADPGPTTPPLEVPVWPLPKSRERSVLTRLTLSAAALVVGVLLFVAAAGTASIPTEIVLASALGVVGLGLVASAWWGRARGLVPVAFLLALALGTTVAVRPAIDHGVGKRDWVARSAGDYHLGVGQGQLTLSSDLSHLESPALIHAQVDVGHLLVLVPNGLRAVVDVHVQLGDIRDGLGGTRDENGRDVHEHLVVGPPGAPQVRVVANMYTGMVEVRHA
jgi:phage shock protein PspC (stress-responsive transcriptional regulator)